MDKPQVKSDAVLAVSTCCEFNVYGSLSPAAAQNAVEATPVDVMEPIRFDLVRILTSASPACNSASALYMLK